MKKFLYLLPTLLLISAQLSAQTEVDLYLQGNGQYEAGDYEGAIKSYMDIVEMGRKTTVDQFPCRPLYLGTMGVA